MAAQAHDDHIIESRAQKPHHQDSSGQRPTSPMADTLRPRSRQRPINEAVSNAFDRAETASYVPPELIAQITQNVIKQLQSTGLDGPTPVQPQQSQFPPPPPPPHHIRQHDPPPTSPSTSTTASGTSPNMPERVLTPPSPTRPSDHYEHTSPLMSTSHPPEPSMSPEKACRTSHFSPNRSSSPTSQTSVASDGNGERLARPKGPTRLHSGMEETTLEKIWGPLFDEDSRPTARLGQFLRGLAVHIIEDYEPRFSLVITPDKMVKYYDEVKLDSELYPWSIVFDDERSSISRMYRELACQHHLVQERYDQRPDIPGLTPIGFERWMTLLIQAHPDAEFERLAKAVLHMPINNPDDRKERFPKDITRRLFPKHEDLDIRSRMEDAMIEHASIEIPRPKRRSQEDVGPRKESPINKTTTDSSMSPPQPPPQPRPSVSFAEPEVIPEPKPGSYVPGHSAIERERAPYSTVPESSIVDDTKPPEPPVSKPIERERKPYVSQVGGGRQYEAEEVRPREASIKPPPGRPESISGPDYKPSRSDSTARPRPIPVNAQNGYQAPPKPEIHQLHRAGANAVNSRSRRSPSFSQGNDYHRPSLDHGSVPRGAGNEPVLDEAEQAKRYFENQARERARKKAEEDAWAYGESPRRGYEPLRPRRADYGNDEDYNRAKDRRDRAYDDRRDHGSYR